MKIARKTTRTYKAYSLPKETKECQICKKEISTKWKSNICLDCESFKIEELICNGV